MSTKMTIGELRESKGRMDLAIEESVAAFENETGATVAEVEIGRGITQNTGRERHEAIVNIHTVLSPIA